MNKVSRIIHFYEKGLILKRKTLQSVVLAIVSFTLNSIAALIVVLGICNYDSVSGMNIKCGHFYRFAEPYGNKVLCLQEMIYEFSVYEFGEMNDCMEIIYIETGSNELKKLWNMEDVPLVILM